MIDALIGAGASLLGGFMANEASAKSAERQMQFQTAANQKAMDFSAAQSQKQMDFQERMSSHAHEREVLDLRAAGLNPILSVNRSGASTPSGAAATGSTSSGAQYQAKDIVTPAVSSAVQAFQLKSIEADIDVKKAQADMVRAQTMTELNQPENVSSMTELNKRRSATEAWGPEQKKWETELTSAQFTKVNAEREAILGWQRKLAEAQASLTSNSALSAGVKAKLDAALSEAERIIGMGEGATSAIRNLNPLSLHKRIK